MVIFFGFGQKAFPQGQMLASLPRSPSVERTLMGQSTNAGWGSLQHISSFWSSHGRQGPVPGFCEFGACYLGWWCLHLLQCSQYHYQRKHLSCSKLLWQRHIVDALYKLIVVENKGYQFKGLYPGNNELHGRKVFLAGVFKVHPKSKTCFMPNHRRKSRHWLQATTQKCKQLTNNNKKQETEEMNHIFVIHRYTSNQNSLPNRCTSNLPHCTTTQCNSCYINEHIVA